MKTVFSSAELPHIWANGVTDYGRNTSNQSFQNGVYFSYGTAIAEVRYHPKTKEKYYILNSTSYSITTSGHQSAVRSSIPAGTRVFRIDGKTMGLNRVVPMDFKTAGTQLFQHAIEMAAQTEGKAERSRKYKSYLEQEAAGWMEKAQEINKFFGLRRKVDKDTVTRIKEAAQKSEREAKRLAKEREERAKVVEDEDLEKWVMGGNVYRLFYNSPVRLRIQPSNPETLETSLGATVSVTTAKRALSFILSKRASGWHENGEKFQLDNYRLNAVNNTGIVAGCHTIKWDEIERFAKTQGWI